jgi:transcriptional regulator with XRE-family HTH domain
MFEILACRYEKSKELWMNKILMDYGLVISDARVKKGYSAKKMGELASIAHSQISRIENEKSELTLNAAVRISSSLELPLRAFLSSKTIAASPRCFQKSAFYRDVPEKRFCLNYNDIDALDMSGLLSSGRASEVVSVFLNYLMILMGNASMPLASSLYVYLGTKDIESLLVGLPALDGAKDFPDWIDLRYPRQLTFDNIRDNYLANGALIYLDIGAYVQRVRLSKGLSLKKLGDAIGFSDQGIRKLENQTAEKIKLEDVLKLDMALGLEGELLDFSWKVAEFYAGIHRTKTKITGRLHPFQSFEIHAIEKLIVVSRLFQHYWPSDDSGIVFYQRYAEAGFPRDWYESVGWLDVP